MRKEAENDRVCYFVEREPSITNVRSTQLNRTQPGLSPLSKEFVSRIIEKLDSEKQKSQQLHQEINQGFSLGDLDFALEETAVDSGNEAIENRGVSEQEQVSSDISNPGINPASQQSTETLVPLAEENYESSVYKVPESAGNWRELVFKNPAPTQEYFQNILEHPTVIKLIVYYTKWLLASMPKSLAEWIFATFVRLDSGLDHQELAIVRALGVKAQKLREKFLEGVAAGAHVSDVAQQCVDMILAVISQYFGQRDLVSIDYDA